MKRIKSPQIKQYIEVGHDPCWSLQEWLYFINKQIKTYGKNTLLHTDAGYNNVALKLIITEDSNES